jgi:hypothetical protein
MGYDFKFTINGEEDKDEIKVSRHNHMLFEIVGGETEFSTFDVYEVVKENVDRLMISSDYYEKNRNQRNYSCFYSFIIDNEFR